MEEFAKQTKEAVKEFLEVSKIGKGNILVVGCSTSEIVGSKIGTNSVPEVAEQVCKAILSLTNKKGVCLAAQCCEHLNRSLVIEEAAAERYGYEQVNVVPQPKAGGSFATTAYETFEAPVMVEAIRAKAGIDIGGTLIGMHLASVAVPTRLGIKQIGEAPIICARVRPKFVGGSRAIYDETLL